MASGVASSAPWRRAAIALAPAGNRRSRWRPRRGWCRWRAGRRRTSRTMDGLASRASRSRVGTFEGTCAPLSPGENPQAGGRVEGEEDGYPGDRDDRRGSLRLCPALSVAALPDQKETLLAWFLPRSAGSIMWGAIQEQGAKLGLLYGCAPRKSL